MEIEVLRKHGLSLRRIASEAGCAVNTVRSHLAHGQKPRYERQKQRVRKLSPYEAYLRERQAATHPHWIPAKVPDSAPASTPVSALTRTPAPPPRASTVLERIDASTPQHHPLAVFEQLLTQIHAEAEVSA
jgi:hypothetical protein